MKILYLIPARGGSKGLPGKNIRLLNNRPMIAYSIDAAKSAAHKGTITVTTDDAEIASIAKKFGAEVPFIRPANLSDDTASSIDVIVHALNFYKEKNQEFDYIVLLQPTSPLRTALNIDEAFEQMKTSGTTAVVSVCEAEHHPLWANSLPEDNRMGNFIREEIKNKNRQQLPAYYRLNGAVYISSVASFFLHKTFIHADTVAYKMPLSESVDIDNKIDFMLAELLLKQTTKEA